MPTLAKSSARLRIFGDELDPDNISSLLGAEPTKSHKKGDVFGHSPSGKPRVTKTGMWGLKARDKLPADLDKQIDEILSQVSGDPAVWKSINSRYEVDLFCGFFLDYWNEGITISVKSMEKLETRRIKLGLDIYGADREGGDPRDADL